MKRFLLAGLLALTIHGLFFGFVPGPVQRKSPQKPYIVTISLASYQPVKPTPAARPPRITQERPSQKPAKKTAKAPRKTLPAKKDVVKLNKKAMPPQKKRTKPIKSVTKLQKKAAKPDMRPKIPREAVVAALIPEKKKASVTPPQSNKVVREARPAYKNNPRPPYPKRARRRGYQGTVVLEALVDRSGKVKELRILRSSGHTILDKAALKSVNGWLFEPGMVGDEKVDMWVRVPVRFELREG